MAEAESREAASEAVVTEADTLAVAETQVVWMVVQVVQTVGQAATVGETAALAAKKAD